jgi:DNA-binding protein H-NS
MSWKSPIPGQWPRNNNKTLDISDLVISAGSPAGQYGANCLRKRQYDGSRILKIDLSGLSTAELQKLKADVEKAIAASEQKRRAEARRAAEEAARKFGFSLDQLLEGAAAGKPSAAGVPKYRNPENPRQTWSGRGRQPGWIKAGLAAGRSLEDFAI